MQLERVELRVGGLQRDVEQGVISVCRCQKRGSLKCMCDFDQTTHKKDEVDPGEEFRPRPPSALSAMTSGAS